MILVDTSVWADHFRRGEAALISCLTQQLVMLHPFVIGELALGHLHPRTSILENLRAAPQAPVAPEGAVLELIESEDLAGTGIGYIDAHLLASVRREGIALWTRDRRLRAAANRMGLASDAD